MFQELGEHDIQCPYCWETITILVDDSVSEQSYVEDCHVCCRPILIDVSVGYDDEVIVNASPENE
jgi:hypothetical protein